MSLFRNLLIANQENNIPAWFTESLVCWYDPKKQGLTNKQIKTETAANGHFLLKDFSKNGLDMKCYGFDGTEDSGMHGDGLVFDGKDDFGKASDKRLALNDYTIIAKRIWINENTFNGTLASKRTANSSENGEFQFERINNINYDFNRWTLSYGVKTEIPRFKTNRITWQTKDSYCGIVPLNKGDLSNKTEQLLLGLLFEGQGFSNVDINSFLLFNRTLSITEIQWVKENIMGESKPPTQDYIQDGLAFHLDCRDAQVKDGVWHWVDKIGKVSFSMHNVLQQEDKGLVFNGVNSYGDTNESFGLSSNYVTVEFAAFIKHTKTKAYLINDYRQDGLFVFIETDGRVVWRKNIYYHSWGNYTFDKKSTTSINSLLGLTNFTNMPKKDFAYNCTGQKSYIGKHPNTDVFINSTIYSIRIYNRLLSKDEILHNQEVDNKIYNLGI